MSARKSGVCFSKKPVTTPLKPKPGSKLPKNNKEERLPLAMKVPISGAWCQSHNLGLRMAFYLADKLIESC